MWGREEDVAFGFQVSYLLINTDHFSTYQAENKNFLQLPLS